jgi:hypothetical protein
VSLRDDLDAERRRQGLLRRDPYTVACPRCLAKAGQPCIKQSGWSPYTPRIYAVVHCKNPHRERVRKMLGERLREPVTDPRRPSV